MMLHWQIPCLDSQKMHFLLFLTVIIFTSVTTKCRGHFMAMHDFFFTFFHIAHQLIRQNTVYEFSNHKLPNSFVTLTKIP